MTNNETTLSTLNDYYKDISNFVFTVRYDSDKFEEVYEMWHKQTYDDLDTDTKNHLIDIYNDFVVNTFLLKLSDYNIRELENIGCVTIATVLNHQVNYY